MFEWDAAKARTNLQKHGVSFDEAASLFEDVTAFDGEDISHSHGEVRRLRLGRSSAGRVLVMAYTMRGAKLRIISARQASRTERRRYAEA